MKFLTAIAILFVSQSSYSQGSQKITRTEIRLTVEVPCTPVQDQYMSSTCWSFASNSFIESELLNESKSKVDLSEMFIARYSYINKVKQFLAQKGGIFFTPGGQFHDVIKVVRQYGMMPESAYNGKARGELNYDQSELDTIMVHYVSGMLKQRKKAPDAADMKFINETLDKYMGRVPEKFTYNGKTYTPKLFSADVLNFNADDYIEITSYTHHPYYKPFILEDKYNWTQDGYYNVPLSDFCEITDAALAKGFSVCWDGDVSEDGFNYNNGIAYLPESVKDPVGFRQSTYLDKSSKLDHMMHVVGIGKDKEGNKLYYLKNSWGSYSNELGGFMFMSDDYFKIKTIAIIVNKKAIPKEIRKKMGI